MTLPLRTVQSENISPRPYVRPSSDRISRPMATVRPVPVRHRLFPEAPLRSPRPEMENPRVRTTRNLTPTLTERVLVPLLAALIAGTLVTAAHASEESYSVGTSAYGVSSSGKIMP